MRTALAMTAALLVWCAPAGAVPAKQCRTVSVHSKAYIVTAHGVSCGFARKWVTRYLKGKHHPKHYRCTGGAGTNVRVNCQGDSKPPGDSAPRYFYGILP